MKKGSFIEAYLEEASTMLETASGRALTEEEAGSLRGAVEGSVEDRPVLIDNTYSGSVGKYSLLSVLDRTLEARPIVTGNGTLFRRAGDGGHNVAGEFVRMLLETRKGVKRRMFEVQERAKSSKGEEKKALEEEKDVLDMRQKVFKVLANAYYGSIGMPAFVFHDPNAAPAVTGTGVNVVTSLVQAFEQLLGDNWGFECWGDVFEFVRASCEKEASYEIGHRPIKVNEVFDRLFGKLPEEMMLPPEAVDSASAGRLNTLLQSLDEEQLVRLYYRNNLYEFLEEDDVQEVLAEILAYDIPSGNPDEVEDEDLKGHLETLWAVVEDYVVLPTFHQGRMGFCDEAEKRAVLVVDTDSTFILLDTFVDWVSQRFDVGEMDAARRISVCNVMVFVLAGYSEIVLQDYARRTNIEDAGRLDLKNEFIFSRIMLTPNKKAYAGSIMSREGKLLEPPKFEITGLDIKKVKVNKPTREYFKRVLQEFIVEAGRIDVPALLAEFVRYEEIVSGSLAAGELTYAQPMKYSGFHYYKEPYQMEVVRGAIIWNDLNPLEPIRDLDNVLMVKTLGSTEEEFDRISKELSGKDGEVASRVRELIFKNKKMAHHGFGRLCLPRSVGEMPSWAKPFVDVETIVHDNVRGALILLESVGIVVLDARNRSRYSNIIRF